MRVLSSQSWLIRFVPSIVDVAITVQTPSLLWNKSPFVLGPQCDAILLLFGSLAR